MASDEKLSDHMMKLTDTERGKWAVDRARRFGKDAVRGLADMTATDAATLHVMRMFGSVRERIDPELRKVYYDALINMSENVAEESFKAGYKYAILPTELVQEEVSQQSFANLTTPPMNQVFVDNSPTGNGE